MKILSISMLVREFNIINVFYNKANRKSIITGLVTSGGITTATSATGSRSSISLSDHGLETGQKIIHIADSPSGGLETDKRFCLCC